jgi:parvulin-like peptidyl-prolyl isomerase
MVKATRSTTKSRLLWLVLLLLAAITACANGSSENASMSPSATPPPGVPVISIDETAATPEPSPTTPPPSPTPQLAAMVNGQPILLETFEKELLRYEMAQAELGFTPGADGEDYQKLVLDALIERELMRQAAEVTGVSITAEMVDTRLAEIREEAVESGGFDSWLAVNRWTEEEFKEALAIEMLVEEMLAEITADVPYTAEQVRASYIQIDDAALAESLLQQIKEGADFAELAARYSRDSVTGPAGGDLGFFARGSLLVPEVEEAAYKLQPQEISEVISATDPQSGAVIHYIVKVTERDPARPLDTSLRYQLLQERFDTWLDEQRASATIVYLLGEG